MASEYLDATCSTPVTDGYPGACVVQTLGGVSKYVLSQRIAGCQLTAHVHRLGANLGPLASAYTRSSDGLCEAAELGPFEDAPYAQEVLDEVAPETFVAAELQRQDGARLQFDRRVSTDGASEVAFGLYDAELGENCDLGIAGDGELRCIPVPTAGNSVYADADCSQRMASEYPDPCMGSVPTPGYATSSEEHSVGGCTNNARTRVYELGDPLQAASVFRVDAGACTEHAAEDGDLFRLWGSEVPPSALIGGVWKEAECDPERTSGERLQTWTLVTDDGAHLYSYFVDTELDERCEYMLASDGQWRCLPSAAVANPASFFADAACTRRVAEVRPCSLASFVISGHLSLRYALLSEAHEDGACRDTRYRIFPVSDTEVSTIYTETLFQDGTARCEPLETYPGDSYRELGPEMPPQMFVAGKETH